MDYGIAIETLSSRDMNDHYCYTLDEVYIVAVDHDGCRYTITELMKGR